MGVLLGWELSATLGGVRAKPMIAWIASWFRHGSDRRGAAAGNKESLTLIIRVQTLEQLRQRASTAARAQGLTETDLAYGRCVAEHIGRSLEVAYQTDDEANAGVNATTADAPPEGDADDGQSTEMTFLAVSLSSAVIQRLRAHAGEDARREAIGPNPAHEDFMFRRMGQLLEAAYRRRT